ncbi:cation:proton antiporter [Haliovirga abyssi]|uniref:Cation:proton antiporter n=1 Tax=Haliovirga abyssi TaxID=2996794 RepID=A0AAU9D443_9FUSO|nr:cation:proton antiporter [Haliovirga abyssi]BDU50734.1 cation:proton antiporter [Haliovirga abyssi]
MINLVVFSLLGIGVFFSILRVILGPSVPDRVVGVDTLNVIITGAIVFLAHIFRNSLYLDIALVYGILAFVETVLMARYLEGRK